MSIVEKIYDDNGNEIGRISKVEEGFELCIETRGPQEPGIAGRKPEYKEAFYYTLEEARQAAQDLE